MALPIFGASAAVSIVNRALFNASPAHNMYLTQISNAGTTAASEYALANQLGASFAVGKKAAELATLVLANVGISATTIPAASYDTLLAAGTDYIAFHGTLNIGIIALQFGQIISSLENDVTFGAAATAWNQEVLSAHRYSNDAANGSTRTGDSVAGNGGIALTMGRDNVNGSAANDTFSADVAQNALGQQVNTLGSGDILNGGAGFDTLDARITNGSFVGGSESQPIQPKTNSIEYIRLQAMWADVNKSDKDVLMSQVSVNAKDMVGVKTISSHYSDASLAVMNLTTKGSTQLSDLTVNMSYTGNADSLWKQSDFKVLFDQDYLTPARTLGTASIDFLAMNEDNYDASKGTNPLTGVFFRTLNFTLNGQEFNLAAYLGEDPAGAGNEINTYADFLAAVQKGLVALKADFADNAALQSVTASFGRQFTTDVNPVTLELRQGTAIRLTADGQSDGVANTLYVDSTDLEVARAGLASVPNNNRYEVADATPPLEGSQLAIHVELEKVGLAGDGGALVIGSMNNGVDANVWGSANTTVAKTTNGINDFYVTVKGGDDKSSSLSALRSTNNQLKVVTVKTDEAQAGTFANLTIGNRNSALTEGSYQHSLKDVKIFDASAFKGDLKLQAALTSEVIAKYLNLKDRAPDEATADNAAFVYTGGTGNDTIDLQVSLDTWLGLTDVLAGVVRFADFSVNIVGGAGNDNITLSTAQERESGDVDGLSKWNPNQALNANLRINAGEGNDIIRARLGNAIIDAGTGDDTVYADNLGDKAVWVLNAASDGAALDDIQSSENHSYRLFKGEVSVSFKGFEATAAIADVRGEVTDLSINQAIKKALNENATLSKLLVAEDGPANTLVITSLIDGAVTAEALGISLHAPGALTAGEIAQLNSWYGVSDTSVASNAAAAAGLNDAAATTYLKQLATAGGISKHISDNTITGGQGNDVLVLGSGADSNDTLVYTGFDNGVDSIVNFTTGGAISTTIPIEQAGFVDDFYADDERPADFGFYVYDMNVATSYTFDGVTVNGGDNPAATIDAFVAQDEAFTNWILSGRTAGGNRVGFTAVDNGVRPAVRPEDFQIVVTTDSTDRIDFSGYGAVGVYVNGELVDGVAPTALGQKYITFIESATNAGSYTVQQWTDAGAVGVIDEPLVNAQLIAVLDFGSAQAFTADSFIL